MASDSYTCSLSEASLKKAKEELNEDPKERLGAVQTFREWLLQQPHLKCPTDSKYLLRFLRYAHFSQLEARTVLEKYLKKKKEEDQWLSDIDIYDKKVKAFSKTGYLIPLPGFNDEGRKVILIRIASKDVTSKDYGPDTLIQFYFLTVNYFLEDEDIQVNGFEFLMDFTGMSTRDTAYMGMDRIKRFIQTWQGSVPVRLKLYHHYNTGAVYDTIFPVLKQFVPSKLMERLVHHGVNLERVYKYVPMRMLPDEYLPDDYKGPSAGPIATVQANFWKDVDTEKTRLRLLEETKSEYCCDESKRPGQIPQESFRRLNID